MVKRGRMNGLDAVAHTTVSLGTRPRRRLWALLLATTTLFVTTAPAIAEEKIPFDLVRSATAETGNCLLDAEGHVTVEPREGAEQMKVTVQGLPPNTAFNLFVTQLPNGPFGLSWYQGDIQTNSKDPSPIPDASSNPATAPVHMYHVGLWFDSPLAAAAAGCPATVTPFNGEHNAGIQALSTRQFPNDHGPLRQIQ
jgi:hypothetical protein